MSIKQYVQRCRQSLNNSRQTRRPPKFLRPQLECLETRVVPSTITWSNEFTSSNFDTVFGSRAGSARAVVHAALNNWARVIDRFNYADGTNTYFANVTIGTAIDTGGGAQGTADMVDSAGKPRTGHMNISGGGDNVGDGRAHGVGWFLDPTPNDSSNFTGGVLTAFAGFAQAGTPQARLNDLYTVVLLETSHMMGFSKNPNLRIWTGGFMSNTGFVIPDGQQEAGIGAGGVRNTYWAFIGPHVAALFNGSGTNQPQDAFNAVHTSAGDGGPQQAVGFRGRTMWSGQDSDNAGYYQGWRLNVSRKDALILQDAYGYSIISPETFGTFYAILNSATGNLLIRGRQDVGSADTITLDTFSGIFGIQFNSTSVALGTPVLGTEYTGPYADTFIGATVSSITVQTSGFSFSSAVNILRTRAGVATTVQTAGQIDSVSLGTGGSVQGILGAVTVDPSGNRANLFVDDSADGAAHGAVTLSDSGPNFGQITGLAPAPIAYRYVNTFSVTVKTGRGSNTVNVRATGGHDLGLEGHSNSTTVNIGDAGRLENIRAFVVITNPPAHTSLNIDDSSDPGNHTTTIHTLSLVPDYGSIQGLAGNVIEYKYADTTGVTVQTGTGTTVVNVLDTLTPLSLTVRGNDTVNVSPTHSLDNIRGNLTISGGSGSHRLNVDDSGKQFAFPFNPGLYTVTPTTVQRSGAALITYAGMTNVALSTGTDFGLGVQVTTSVTGTAAGTVYGVTVQTVPVGVNFINVGNGNNTLDAIRGNLIVTGAGVTNVLSVFDQRKQFAFPGNAGAYTVTPTTVQRNGAALITYAGMADVLLSTGTDFGGGAQLRTSVTGTAAGTDYGVTLQTVPQGVNFIDVGAGSGTLDAIRGNLTVTAAGGVNVLSVFDQVTSTGQTYTIASNSLTRSGTAQITYRNLQALVVAGGSGGNTFNVQSTLVGAALGVDGGGGSNTLQGPNTNTTWQVTGTNAGNFTGGVSFTSMQSLTGGAGADTFVFSDGAGVTGSIDGGVGAGINTLDYSAYASSNVLVNLQTSFATGVGGRIANIQNATGASGGAAGSYNILVGNGGNVLTGGNGRRNLLIAGASASTLIGGGDDDILIGGTTTYDTEAGMASLTAIMNYWAGTADDYATRVANLLSGAGVPLLDASVVFNNGGGNTLQGNAGGAAELNLFYGLDPTQETTDYNPAIGEQFINV